MDNISYIAEKHYNSVDYFQEDACINHLQKTSFKMKLLGVFEHESRQKIWYSERAWLETSVYLKNQISKKIFIMGLERGGPLKIPF